MSNLLLIGNKIFLTFLLYLIWLLLRKKHLFFLSLSFFKYRKFDVMINKLALILIYTSYLLKQSMKKNYDLITWCIHSMSTESFTIWMDLYGSLIVDSGTNLLTSMEFQNPKNMFPNLPTLLSLSTKRILLTLVPPFWYPWFIY